MKIYFDTEFLEGTQKKMFGRTKPTIDLISIGLVNEDNKGYYAISKDFNLKEAWNRWQPNDCLVSGKNQQGKYYWIRENVLKPIFDELARKDNNTYFDFCKFKNNGGNNPLLVVADIDKFNYRNLKKLINKYGKTNKQIAEDIKEFCSPTAKIVRNPNGKYDFSAIVYEPESERTYDGSKVSIFHDDEVGMCVAPITIGEARTMGHDLVWDYPEFYAYYADYDWTVFCWLFGTMMDLPTGFPMYCIDLKQILDEKALAYDDRYTNKTDSLDSRLKSIKNKDNYPKQENEHNAYADAMWNKKLHEFLNTL